MKKGAFGVITKIIIACAVLLVNIINELRKDKKTNNENKKSKRFYNFHGKSKTRQKRKYWSHFRMKLQICLLIQGHSFSFPRRGQLPFVPVLLFRFIFLNYCKTQCYGSFDTKQMR